MNIKKILDNIGDPSLENNRIFVGKDYAIQEYDFEKDDCFFLIKPDSDFFDYIYRGYTIKQKKGGVTEGESEGNRIQIRTLDGQKIIADYEYNILLGEDSLGEDFFLSTYTKGGQEFFVSFNPFTKSKKWEVAFDKELGIRVNFCNPDFFVLRNNFELMCYSSKTGEQLWSFNAEPYTLQDNPIQDNGEPFYDIAIQELKYNPIHDQVLVHLYPNKLLALEATTGKLIWAKDIPQTIQWHIDEQTGNIYMMETLSYLEDFVEGGQPYEANHISCVYYHVNGIDGKNLLRRNLKEVIAVKHENGQPARELGPHHFAGYKDYCLYLSLFSEGEIYQLNKYTGDVENRYIHDRSFESFPIIYKNRLFVTDPQTETETRLLVFEI